jgi:hypothetical protein
MICVDGRELTKIYRVWQMQADERPESHENSAKTDKEQRRFEILNGRKHSFAS